MGRYRCSGCTHVRRQDTPLARKPRARRSRRALRRARGGIVCQHLSRARVAGGGDVARSTANDAIPTERQRVLISHDSRFEVALTLGVDDFPHAALQQEAPPASDVTPQVGKRVTLIIDLTLVELHTGRIKRSSTDVRDSATLGLSAPPALAFGHRPQPDNSLYSALP